MIRNPKPWPFKGSVWTVSPDGYADFLTIQEAIDESATGDTVWVGPGTYPEILTIGKQIFLDATSTVQGIGNNAYSTKISPVLAVGEAGITITAGIYVHMRGFMIEPVTGAAGTASAVRVSGSSSLVLEDCVVFFSAAGGSVGPFYAFEHASSGFSYIDNCTLMMSSLGGAPVKRALYHSGTGRVVLNTVTTGEWFDPGGGFVNGDVEVNNAGAKLDVTNSTIRGAFTVTAADDFFVDVTTRITGARTTPGDPAIFDLTPNGIVWYDTATAKLRGREGGVSKDLINPNTAFLTRIAGITGDAGADLTWQRLTANSADVTTVALGASVMTTTLVGVGVWRFRYTLLYQAAATTTGIAFGINHTGTVTKFRAMWTHITTGAGAATGVGDDDTAVVAGQMAEGKADGVLNAVIGSASAGVAAANTDIIVVLTGILVVTVTGTLELKIASEVAGSAVRIMADSNLELHAL